MYLLTRVAVRKLAETRVSIFILHRFRDNSIQGHESKKLKPRTIKSCDLIDKCYRFQNESWKWYQHTQL